MNGGWVPFDATGWPETVELLQATGKSWPDAAAIFDLRWHVDQGLPLPGRDELQARWRWKEWRTRTLLGTPERWWDPSKGGTPPESRSELEQRVPVRRRTNANKAQSLQDSSRTPPGDLQESSGQLEDEPTELAGVLQDSSRTPPGDLQASSIARTSAHPAPSTVGGGGGRTRAGAGPDLGDNDEMALAKAELLAMQVDEEPQHGLPSERDHIALNRELHRGHSPAVLQIVWVWSGQSDHPHARACRDSNWRRWGALLKRPQFEERLAAALEWDAAGRPAAKATGPPKPGQKRFSVSELIAAEAAPPKPRGNK